MKVLLLNGKETKDISQLVTSITWSGDYQQAARKLEINLVASADANIPMVNVALGNMIKLFDNADIELFRGYIFTREKSSSSNEIRMTAYDGLIYLLKSKGTYNFKKMTAEAITRKVASDFGIPIGSLASTGIVQSFIADSQTIYDIIMQAYTGAAKQNGKKYMPLMQQGKLNVIEKGKTVAKYVLSADTNIIDSSYSESIEDMINRVRIYDDKGNQIGRVENLDWIKAYGVLQDVYVREKDKNPQTVAKSMLKGIARTASISALGDTSCITGMAVQVKESYTGLSGLFYIDTDTHTWQEGKHTMELGISFQNMMDTKEANV